MNFKILNTIGSVYTPEARALLGQSAVVDDFAGTQAELEAQASDYDALVVGLGYRINAQVLRPGGKLKAVATATTGLDHIDLAVAQSSGIEVLSLKGEDAFLDTITGTAELALGLMLSLARHLSPAQASVLGGEWDRERFRGHNLAGQTLGIVGLGRLGKMMARYGQALGMRVLYTDPAVAAGQFPGYTSVSFSQLIRESDFISLHLHLAPETKNLFSAPVFAEMKKGAYLINTSRGEIVDEQNLLRALESGQLAGYGADVLAGELEFNNKKFAQYPLVEYARSHSNVVIVPHIGGMTFESRELTDIFMAKKLVQYADQYASSH